MKYKIIILKRLPSIPIQ